MKSRFKILFLVLLAVFAFAQNSHAVLQSVGPVTQAFPNAYPTYYEDNNGLALGICPPTDPFCPPPVPGEVIPVEQFYFLASATDPGTVPGLKAVLVLAIEASYGNGVTPLAGDEITFARLRVRVRSGLTVPGNYTVIHPYGQLVINVPANDLTINFTQDIGIAPGIFTGALKGTVGPFLKSTTAPPGYVGLGTGTELITGGPNGNVFTLIDPTGAVIFTQNQWSINGKITLPLNVTSATYSRIPTAGLTLGNIDILAHSSAGSTLQALDGATLLGVLGVPNAAAPEEFFGDFPLPAVIPPSVTVSATLGATTVTQTKALTDIITVLQANYDLSTRTINVVAASSDQLQPGGPTLSLVGFGVGGANLPMTFDPLFSAPALNITGAFKATIGNPLTPAAPGNPAAPPATITVVSSVGGTATVPVGVIRSLVPPQLGADTASTGIGIPVTINVLANDVPVTGLTVTIATPSLNGTAVVNPDGTVTFTPNPGFVGTTTFVYRATDVNAQSATATVTVTVSAAPTAVADAATTPLNTPVTISVLANDTPAANINAATAAVTVATPPASGSAVANLNGTITFTPAAGVGGAVTFTYTFKDIFGQISAPGTVTVTVDTPPVANADSAQTNRNTAATINVLANDTAPGAAIAPATVTVVTAPTHGTATANATGTVTYTPATGYFGPDSFTYNVKDTAGSVSNTASVTITVVVPETLSINRAAVRGTAWVVEGTTSIFPANPITIRAGGATGPVVATVNPDNGGRWKFTARSIANPAGNTTVTVVSSFGNTRTGALLVQ